MYWLLLDMYSEILDLGLEVFVIKVTLSNRMKGLGSPGVAGRAIFL